MRLHRGIHPEPVETYCKKPEEYIQSWKKEEGEIWLSGTKTPGASRETNLRLELEEADVIALFQALLERYADSGNHAIVQEVLAMCLKSTIKPLAPDLRNSNRLVGEDGLFSLRTYDCLTKARIQTIGELARKTEVELLMVCPRKSVDEIKEVLSSTPPP
jgi:hypothetical protein